MRGPSVGCSRPLFIFVGGHSRAQRDLGPAFPAPRAPAEWRATVGSPGLRGGRPDVDQDRALGRSGGWGNRERRAPQAFPCLARSSAVTPCGRRPHPASTKAQEPRHREAPIGYQTELRADPPYPRGERWGCPVGWADSPRRRRCAGTGRPYRLGQGFAGRQTLGPALYSTFFSSCSPGSPAPHIAPPSGCSALRLAALCGNPRVLSARDGGQEGRYTRNLRSPESPKSGRPAHVRMGCHIRSRPLGIVLLYHIAGLAHSG